ncbi:MAG: hypothetical protein J6M34_04830 [Clostridia bacterium]|nr:hypothetical protein [Clostridia bacterium]
MSEDFKAALTDGKYVFHSVKPSDQEDVLFMLTMDYFYVENERFGADASKITFEFESFADDLSSAVLNMYRGQEKVESHRVDVLWQYDEKVQGAVSSLVQKIPKNEDGGMGFDLTDLEFVNYMVYNKSTEQVLDELANFSDELKAITENTNFSIKIQTRAGADDPFYTERLGDARFFHGDTVYYAQQAVFARANHVIYVPESTEITEDALVFAAQTRIDDYVGAGRVKVSGSGETVAGFYTKQIAEYDKQMADLQEEIASLEAIVTAEQAKDPSLQNSVLLQETTTKVMERKNTLEITSYYKRDAVARYNNGEYQQEYLRNAAGDFLFNVEALDRGESYKFVIVRDDTKLSVPSYASVDFDTGVSVSTDSSEVPLDAVIKVNKVTQGKEHERICGVLKIDDSEMFDIQLFSGSIDDFVSQLKNGKFKVQLPIPQKYMNKSLVVYYVDGEGNTTEFDVTVKNGFAFFETDHFSIYTLTAKADNPSAPSDTDSSADTTSSDTDITDIVDSLTSESNGDVVASDTDIPAQSTLSDTDSVSGSDLPKEEVGGTVWFWLIPVLILAVGCGVTVFFFLKKKPQKTEE